MAASIITVARTLGAGGEEVGRLVAAQLGFRYVDNEIIIKAADTAGVSPETVEKAEHRPTLIQRIIDGMAAFPAAGDGTMVTYAAMMPAPPAPDYARLIERVIHDTAHEGKAVIVAHGAGIPLAGMPGLLRVLVTASPAARMKRIEEGAGMDARAAKKAVEESDRERAAFLKRFYSVGEELPVHYDLTINTDALPPEQAARVVVVAAGD